MAEANSFYKCSVCGNVVEVVEAHEGVLVCCGKEMDKLEEKVLIGPHSVYIQVFSSFNHVCDWRHLRDIFPSYDFSPPLAMLCELNTEMSQKVERISLSRSLNSLGSTFYPKVRKWTRK